MMNMKNNISRRTVISGLTASALVIGFDLTNRSWVTSVNAASIFAKLPTLDGVLSTDENIVEQARTDFGYIIYRKPIAVLKPASVSDIIRIIKFASTHKIQVAARGQGHSVYGQPLVEAGVVIDTSTLNAIHSIESDSSCS